MHILFTLFQLDKWTWSEQYILTLANSLRRENNTVSFFCLFKWTVAKHLEEQWMKVYTIPWWCILWKLNTLPLVKYLVWIYIYLYWVLGCRVSWLSTEFDLVHFQHQSTIRILYKYLKNIPKVQFSHWILSQEEKITYQKFPMDWYWVVSQELYEQYKKILPNNVPLEIFYNPIDVDYFQATQRINKNLKSVLLISKKILNNTQAIEQLKRTCDELNINLTCIWLPNKRVSEIKSYIENADLVIWIGRCVYEAMAMERAVLVYDYLWMDWLIDSEETFLKLRKNNLSWRTFSTTRFSDKALKDQFWKYTPEQWIINRKLIETYNSKFILEGIVSFYNQVITWDSA